MFTQGGNSIFSPITNKNHEEKLQYFYHWTTNYVVSEQHPITGLFPRYTDKDAYIASLRENAYICLSLLTASLAFKRIDDIQCRTYEMIQSGVTCLRGILKILLKYSRQLNDFINRGKYEHPLPTMYNVNTGEELKCNFELDGISMFLHVLMVYIYHGCEVILTHYEYVFVQNLIFYVERSYRLPDYGYHTLGDRSCVGKTEICSTTIGTTLAAIQVASLINMKEHFIPIDMKGSYAGASTSGQSTTEAFSVDWDAYNRNLQMFESLLPRQSSSKFCDAGQIKICGFPFFTVRHSSVVETIMDNVKKEFSHEYGYKRYHCDPFAVDQLKFFESSTNSYDKRKILLDLYNSTKFRLDNKFDHLNYYNRECRYPYFVILHAITCLFQKRHAQEQALFESIKKTLLNCFEFPIVPLFYYKSGASTTADDKDCCFLPFPPISSASDDEVGGSSFCVFPQAMLIMYFLLKSNLVNVEDMKPMYDEYVNTTRTNFGSTLRIKRHPIVIQVALICSDYHLIKQLATYGIIAQHLDELDPYVVISPNKLVDTFCDIGRCTKLNLMGRPARPLGLLSSSRFYHINDRVIISLPLRLQPQTFFITGDAEIFVYEFEYSLDFLNYNWHNNKRPTVVLYLQPAHFAGKNFNIFMGMLHRLKSGKIGKNRILLNRLQDMYYTGCVEFKYFTDTKSIMSIESISTKDLLDVKHIMSEEGRKNSSSIEPTPLASALDPLEFQQQLSIENEAFQSGDYNATSSDDNTFKSVIEINLDRFCSETVDQVLKEQLQVDFKYIDKLMLVEKNLHVKLIMCHWLVKNFGLDHVITTNPKVTVKKVLKEIYLKSTVKEIWDIVRYCSGLLGFLLDSLSPALTYILLSGRQVSFGSSYNDNYNLNIKVTEPPKIDTVYQIFNVLLTAESPIESQLQQEILSYIFTMLNVGKKHMDNISYIHVGDVLEAMRLVSVRTDFNNNLTVMSPSDLRHLLTATISVGAIEIPTEGSGTHHNSHKNSNRAHPSNGSERRTISKENILEQEQWEPVDLRTIKGLLGVLRPHLYKNCQLILECCSEEGYTLNGQQIAKWPNLLLANQGDWSFGTTLFQAFNENCLDPALKELTLEAIVEIAKIIETEDFKQKGLVLRGLNITRLINKAKKYCEGDGYDPLPEQQFTGTQRKKRVSIGRQDSLDRLRTLENTTMLNVYIKMAFDDYLQTL